MPSLQGHIALVTGAGRGIGRAIGRTLAAEGARVVLAARTEEQLRAVAAEIEAAGGHAEVEPADIAREDDVQRLFARIAERHGRLDILINNAGVGSFGPLRDFSAAELDRILAVNVRGTFLASREAVRLMQPRRAGAIVSIASVVAFRGYPNQAAYAASKHAVLGMMKSLANEAQGHGIRVSAVLPGGVNTELIGDARPDLDRTQLLQPEDIARTVLFLLTLPPHAAIDEIYIRRRSSQPW
jgi:NAD(P)-dependent dehydrogenase (short-subunit alcohol dehydrogenase family)